MKRVKPNTEQCAAVLATASHDSPESGQMNLNWVQGSVAPQESMVDPKGESEGVSCSVVSDSWWPHGVTCQAPLSMEFSRKEYWSR